MSEQSYPSYLIHYGIEGQKWGVRRFQNEDGTYTEDGLVRRRRDQDHFIRAQRRAGLKFDRYTEKMRKDKAKGKVISDKRIEKATKLGTKFRSYDYMSKDPDTYLKANKLRAASLAKFGVNAATVAAGLGSVIKDEGIMKDLKAKQLLLAGDYVAKQNGMYYLNRSKSTVDSWGHSPADIGLETKHTKNIKLLENIGQYLKENPSVTYNKEDFKKAPKFVKEFLQTQGNMRLGEDSNITKDWLNKSNKMVLEGLRDQELLKQNSWVSSALHYNSELASEKISKIDNQIREIGKHVNFSAIFTAANLGRTVTELAVEQHLINKMLKTHYKESNEKARQETIKDLKKHGFQKESEIAEAKQSKIKSLIASGKTQEEVAKILGISASTVNKYK